MGHRFLFFYSDVVVGRVQAGLPVIQIVSMKEKHRPASSAPVLSALQEEKVLIKMVRSSFAISMSTNDGSTTNREEHGLSSDGGDYKLEKAILPEGMSKNAWKRFQKQKKWDEQKNEFRIRRKEKKRAARQRKSERKIQGTDPEELGYHQEAKRALPHSQEPSGVKVIMDCEFDELMNDKEIVSMSNQITRCYSAKRHSKFDVGLLISSFNKRLKQRFDTSIENYSKWKGIQFQYNDSLSEILPMGSSDLSKYVYLTADTDNEILELKKGYTYIIGGIVDKNRHKELCLKKANILGLQVGKLPIGKHIQMNSRNVLATSHVYEIMCMWLDSNQDWRKAFNSVLPPRKLKIGGETVARAPGDSEVLSKIRQMSHKEENEKVLEEDVKENCK